MLHTQGREPGFTERLGAGDRRFVRKARQLKLRPQTGERRAQLVCGIAGKAALAFKGAGKFAQQRIHRLDQRADFIGQVLQIEFG